MKKLSIALIVGLGLGIHTFAQSICSPSFNEIFNFEIGDVFTYKYTTYDWSTGSGITDVNSYSRSFEVKDKTVKGDTLMYIMDGTLPPTTTTHFGFMPLNEPPVISDTVILIDSINHVLNQCADSVINFQFPDPEFDSVFSHVIIEYEDGKHGKSLGGWDNLYKYVDGELEDFSTFHFEEKYAANLGLIYQYSLFFEFAEKIELANYIRAGDTTIFVSVNSQEYHKSDLKLFPNPIVDKLHVESNNGKRIGSIQIYDINGRLIETFMSDGTNLEIDFSKYPKGVYYITIRTDHNMVSKKAIKL